MAKCWNRSSIVHLCHHRSQFIIIIEEDTCLFIICSSSSWRSCHHLVWSPHQQTTIISVHHHHHHHHSLPLPLHYHQNIPLSTTKREPNIRTLIHIQIGWILIIINFNYLRNNFYKLWAWMQGHVQRITEKFQNICSNCINGSMNQEINRSTMMKTTTLLMTIYRLSRQRRMMLHWHRKIYGTSIINDRNDRLRIIVWIVSIRTMIIKFINENVERNRHVFHLPVRLIQSSVTL